MICDTSSLQKGYTILNVDDSQTLAAISPDGKETVIVALNNTPNTVTITYHITPNLNYSTDIHDRQATITLKPWSVETIVVM